MKRVNSRVVLSCVFEASRLFLRLDFKVTFVILLPSTISLAFRELGLSGKHLRPLLSDTAAPSKSFHCRNGALLSFSPMRIQRKHQVPQRKCATEDLLLEGSLEATWLWIRQSVEIFK